MDRRSFSNSLKLRKWPTNSIASCRGYYGGSEEN